MKSTNPTVLFSLMGLPIIYFYWFVYNHTINVPYLDDFQILNTVVRVQNEPLKWFTILTENFNGHRFGEIKILVWLDYLIEGQVNFKTLCIFGSFFLFGFWFFCLKIARENNIAPAYLLPFTIILFQPIFHRNVFWMLSCLQYQQSIFFTLVAYYYLSKFTKQSFVISIVLGIIHTQINGNAIYIFMFGALIPLYQGRYKMMTIYVIIGIISGMLFYWNMPTLVGLAGYTLQDLMITNPTILLNALGGFLGGAINLSNVKTYYIAALGIGLACSILFILLILFLLVFKNLYKNSFIKYPKIETKLLKLDIIFKQRITMIMMAGSLLLTAVGVAISRGVFHQTIMLVDRYYLYSVITIAVVYLLIIMFTEGKIRMVIGIISLPLSIFFSLYSYQTAISQVLFFEHSLEADIYDLRHHRTTNNKMFGFSPTSLDLFEESLRRKIYQFPKSRFDTLENLLSEPINNQGISKLNLQFSFSKELQKVYGGVRILHINNQGFYLSENNSQNIFFIVLKNRQNNDSYIIYPQRSNALRSNFWSKYQIFTYGFTTMIQQDCVKKGMYSIGLLIFENGKANLKYTRQSIDIDNTKMIDWMQTLGYFKNT